MIFGLAEIIGGAILRCRRQCASQMQSERNIIAVLFAPSAVAANGDGRRQRIYVPDPNVLKGDNDQAPPNGCPLEFTKCEGRPPSEFYFAAADGFLQQATDNPRIGRDWFGLDEQIGISVAGEPLLRPVKCVVHDVPENCEKTLAVDRLRASEMRAARKKNLQRDARSPGAPESETHHA